MQFSELTLLFSDVQTFQMWNNASQQVRVHLSGHIFANLVTATDLVTAFMGFAYGQIISVVGKSKHIL